MVSLIIVIFIILLKARKIAIKPLIDASPKIENRAAVKEVKHR